MRVKILILLGVVLSSHLLPAQVPLGAPETGFGPPLPRTLPELLDKADLVVRGTVVAVSGPWAQESDGPEGRPPTHIVRHLQTVEIQSVIKGDADLVRRRVVVRQTGGTVRVNGQEVSSLTRTRIFGEGDDVILLLEAFGQPAENVYYVTHAPAGALFVDAAGMTTLTRGLLTYPEFRRVSRGSRTTAATAEAILRDATSLPDLPAPNAQGLDAAGRSATAPTTTGHSRGPGTVSPRFERANRVNRVPPLIHFPFTN